MKKTLTFSLFFTAIILQATHAAITDGLVAYYSFNGNANDLSGNGHDGTVSGAQLAGDRFGNLNSTYSFNGVSNFISGTFTPIVGNFTLSLWFRANSPDALQSESSSGTFGYSQQYAIFPKQGGTDSGMGLSIGTNGVSIFEHGNAFLPAVLVHPQSFGDSWTQAVLTVSNNGAPDLFINGIKVDTGLQTGRTKILSVFANPTEGVGGGGYGHFDGLLDDIRVYDRALSDSDVSQLYSVESIPELSSSVLCGLVVFGWTLRRRR